MYPSPFEYRAATSVADAIDLLQQYGDEGKVLAGGHSLIPLMKLRLSAPAALIDLGRIGELRGIERNNGDIAIGAMTTYNALLQNGELQDLVPLLAGTIQHIGDIQVRNRGTAGGAVAHADPAGDLPATFLALDAQLTVVGPNGERTVPIRNFIQGPFTTDLAPDELLTRITIKRLAPGTGMAYVKLRNPASGYAVVGVAAVVQLDSSSSVREARVALTGVASQPVCLSAVEEGLRGQTATDSVLADAAERAADDLEIIGDLHASAEYRAQVARVYARRALQEAVQHARSQISPG